MDGVALSIARGPGQDPTPARARGITTGAGEVGVLDISPMPSGDSSVAAFLGRPQPVIAHRSGSLAYPECSLQAATASLWAGYGAQEVSLAMTSDGVLFGAHDQYLDRVVLGTDTKTLLPSAMTWAQVSQLTIQPPAGRAVPAQPFMRLDTYLETYARHVVTFIDVKYVPWQRWAGILDLLDSYGGPSRFIAKFFGPSVTHGWLTLARSRGYLAWGYGYEADALTLDTWVDNVDLLGAPWDMSQAGWDAYLATGKRVLSHICPTPAAVTTAIAKGARGHMVSGTHLVTPT